MMKGMLWHSGPWHSGPTAVWIVSHPSHLCIQVSFPEHEIAFLSLQKMVGGQRKIYPDPGVEKLPGVNHFTEWGCVCVSKLHSAQNSPKPWNAIVSTVPC